MPSVIRIAVLSHLLGVLCFGQEPQVIWSTVADTYDADILKIRPTRDGGYVLVGQPHVVRLDSNGTVLWTKTFGGFNQTTDIMETNWGFLVVGFPGGEKTNKLIRLDAQGDSLGLAHGSGFLEPAKDGGAWTKLDVDNADLSGDGVFFGNCLLRLDSDGYVLERWDEPRTFLGSASGNGNGLALLLNFGGNYVIEFRDEGGVPTRGEPISVNSHPTTLTKSTDGYWAGERTCYRSRCRETFHRMNGSGTVQESFTNSADTMQVVSVNPGPNGSILMAGGEWRGDRTDGGEIRGLLVDNLETSSFPSFSLYETGMSSDSLPRYMFPQFGSPDRVKSTVPKGGSPSTLKYFFRDALSVKDNTWILVGNLENWQGKSIVAIKVAMPEDPTGIRRSPSRTVVRPLGGFHGRSLLGRWISRF